MELGRDSSLTYQFRYTFEDELGDEMTSASHASQTSKKEFRSDLSPPNPFQYTFGDKLEEEMTSAKREANLKNGVEKGLKPAISVSVYF